MSLKSDQARWSRKSVDKFFNYWAKRLEPVEHLLESILFFWRWILVLGYVTLAVCLAILSLKTMIVGFHEFRHFWSMDESLLIGTMLGIVDMILIGNLVLMVLFVGYTNFVSKIDFDAKETDQPDWMSELDYGGLKIQLLGSIVAISSVSLLKNFLDLVHSGDVNSEQLMWMMALHGVFVFSILIFSFVNRMEHGSKHEKKAKKDGVRKSPKATLEESESEG